MPLPYDPSDPASDHPYEDRHPVDDTETCHWCGEFRCCFKTRIEVGGLVFCRPYCVDAYTKAAARDGRNR